MNCVLHARNFYRVAEQLISLSSLESTYFLQRTITSKVKTHEYFDRDSSNWNILDFFYTYVLHITYLY